MVDEKTPETDGAGDDAPKNPVNPAALRPHKPKPRVQYSDEDERKENQRRDMRRRFVWHGMAAFLTLNLFAFMRFFFPRTLFEPKTKFAIGNPSEYGYGVDTRWQARQRIWVCRGAEGLFVILAKCTHLGCTPDWKELESKFKCPCHGSGFDSEGINFEGPAPRPLDRCHVELSPTGEVVVDKLRVYQEADFKATGAVLRV